MTKPKGPRDAAEARFERLRKAVADELEDELTAMRKKNARLRALREQKQADEQDGAAEAERRQPEPK
jgi:hypothetical protein